MKKKINIGINGFGRIGRVASRILLNRANLNLVAINSRADSSSHAYLLKYDSTYGIYPKEITYKKDYLQVNKEKIFVLNHEKPGDIPWNRFGVDIVIDSTGKFRTSLELSSHLKKGVTQVVISAPAKDNTKTLVLGVNQQDFNPAKDKIISNSSCTTNCLATTLKVLHDNFKVKNGFMTTIHAVTDSQNLLDNSHKKNTRLRRAAFVSAIPSTTGSAVDIGKLFPDLSGKIVCQAIRIPLMTVSLIVLTVQLHAKISKEIVNKAFADAATGQLKEILDIAKEELVSSDFKGNTHSTIIDPYFTQVLPGNYVNIYAWYDNEWGYASRLVDIVEYIAKRRKLL